VSVNSKHIDQNNGRALFVMWVPRHTDQYNTSQHDGLTWDPTLSVVKVAGQPSRDTV